MINSDNNQAYSKGFTLIELMISIAIVAILVAMAVPAYNDYTVRSKVAECINGAAVAKISISEYRQSLGAWPPTMVQAGLNTAGMSYYCTALNNYQPTTGSFTIDANEAVIGSPLAIDSVAPVMTPTATSSNIINWKCSRGATSANNLKYLPATCRGT
ncbi:pilin [Pseudomonadota bacterium]